jgi:ribosomal protein L11 methyltransferase
MPYLELVVKVNEPAVEIASDFLISELGFSGVVTEDVFLNRENSFGVIKAYAQDGEVTFDEQQIKQKLLDQRNILLERGLSDAELGYWSCFLSRIEDESWAENWKKYWNVQKIGTKTVICPSWLEYEPARDEIKIELDPGCAFGTGTHPTTRLCIRELEKYVTEDSTVADIGCGSGILAIAAKKLGAKEVVGVDTDSDSVRVSDENAVINNAVCKFWQGTACDVKDSYDIVVANILAHVIIEIMPDLKAVTKADGLLILSGIIEEKADDVISAMEQNAIKLVSKEIEPGNGENWICLVGKNQ